MTNVLIYEPVPLEKTVVPEALVDADTLYKDTLGVPVVTYQLALQIAIEQVVNVEEPTMVVLPITSSPETLSAVLRAGGVPCLLDIDERTLQLDSVTLEDVLKEHPGTVVVLNQPGGWELDPRLKVCDSYAVDTILDSRFPVGMTNYASGATFVIYDFGPLIGGGGLVWCSSDTLRNKVKFSRSGILGHSAHFPPTTSFDLGNIESLHKAIQQARELYLEVFKDFKLKLKFSHFDRFPLFEHESAPRIISKLNDYGFRSSLACVPLYSFDAVKARWEVDPTDAYPVADKMWKRIVALPMTTDRNDIIKVATAIKEVL